MRVKHSAHGTKLWLSADDTYRWAHRSGQSWPGSDLSGHRVYVALDQRGDLVDITVDGKYGDPDTGMHGNVEVGGDELDAIIEDAIGDAHLSGDKPVRRGSFRRRANHHLLGRTSSRTSRRSGRR